MECSANCILMAWCFHFKVENFKSSSYDKLSQITFKYTNKNIAEKSDCEENIHEKNNIVGARRAARGENEIWVKIAKREEKEFHALRKARSRSSSPKRRRRRRKHFANWIKNKFHPSAPKTVRLRLLIKSNLISSVIGLVEGFVMEVSENWLGGITSWSHSRKLQWLSEGSQSVTSFVWKLSDLNMKVDSDDAMKSLRSNESQSLSNCQSQAKLEKTFMKVELENRVEVLLLHSHGFQNSKTEPFPVRLTQNISNQLYRYIPLTTQLTSTESFSIKCLHVLLIPR